jgi:hypothetical protein
MYIIKINYMKRQTPVGVHGTYAYGVTRKQTRKTK